jgi:signal transduction histidine kinase
MSLTAEAEAFWESNMAESFYRTLSDFSVNSFSENAKLLLSLRDPIIDHWVKRVQEKLEPARTLSPPILIDTLPIFFEHVVLAISHVSEAFADANSTNTFAQEHGGVRARLSYYNYDQLIQEYYFFRQTIFDIAKERGINFTTEERVLIYQSIDCAIKEAAMGFALVQANIREQFMATLTHDLRNPLSAIKMAAEMAYETKQLGGEISDLLTIVVENAERADSMIQDLLDTSLVTSGLKLRLRIEDCDFFQIAHDTLGPLTLIHGSRLQLKGQHIKGWGDPKALRRALENLVVNAIKYGSSEMPITLTVALNFERVLFTVHNHGDPVPIEEQEAIFQVFRRSQQHVGHRAQGWGLGLAMVRGVAESHGGSINVESAVGTGTSFTLNIPQDARPFQEVPVLK